LKTADKTIHELREQLATALGSNISQAPSSSVREQTMICMQVTDPFDEDTSGYDSDPVSTSLQADASGGDTTPPPYLAPDQSHMTDRLGNRSSYHLWEQPCRGAVTQTSPLKANLSGGPTKVRYWLPSPATGEGTYMHCCTLVPRQSGMTRVPSMNLGSSKYWNSPV
jgi:hypothetical protein